MTAQPQLPLTDPSSSSPAPLSASPAAPAPAAASAPATPSSAAPAAPAAVTRPEGLPDTYWDSSANALKVDPTVLASDLKKLNELSAKDAVAESKRLTLPQAPDAYKIELPADFKPPEGVTFEFKQDDPLLGQAKTLAHELGIPQEGFSKLLSLYAAVQVQDQATITAAKTAEIGKLGVNGPARVSAVTNWLKAMGGADADTLVSVLDYAPVAGTVQAFERMMQRFSSQGGAPFSQQHRDSSGEKLTDEAYEKLSYSEKKAYAAKHSAA